MESDVFSVFVCISIQPKNFPYVFWAHFLFQIDSKQINTWYLCVWSTRVSSAMFFFRRLLFVHFHFFGTIHAGNFFSSILIRHSNMHTSLVNMAINRTLSKWPHFTSSIYRMYSKKIIIWNKVNIQNVLLTQCNLIYNIINLEYMNWLFIVDYFAFFFRSRFLTCDIKILMKYFIFRSNEKGKRKFKLTMAVLMQMHMCSFTLIEVIWNFWNLFRNFTNRECLHFKYIALLVLGEFFAFSLFVFKLKKHFSFDLYQIKFTILYYIVLYCIVCYRMLSYEQFFLFFIAIVHSFFSLLHVLYSGRLFKNTYNTFATLMSLNPNNNHVSTPSFSRHIFSCS